MRDLSLLFHNIRDHIETLLAVLRDNQAKGAARERLLAHLRKEELENQKLLEEAAGSAPAEEKHAIGIALDHSRFIVDIIQGEEIAPPLAVSLLDHFLEEHDQEFLVPPGAAKPAAGWTVGSLLKRNGP